MKTYSPLDAPDAHTCLFAQRHTNVECVSHVHMHLELILVTDGVLQMTVGNSIYDIPKGSAIFVPPFETHAFRSPDANASHVLMFHKELLPSFSAFLQSHVLQRHIFAVSPTAQALVQALLPHAEQTLEGIAAEAVLAPLCYDAFLGCQFREQGEKREDKVYAILEYIHRNFSDESLNQTTVAQAIGLHPVTVSKLLSRHTGHGFCYHLQYRRCSHAARLLRQGTVTVAEVASESGFGSIRSFNRTFLGLYGISPSQYRARSSEHCFPM